MNLKSHITKPIAIYFIVGLLVGGFLIGVIDAKRPQPLFSSADPMAELPIECVGTGQQALNYFTWANSQPRPVRPDIYAGWEQEWENIVHSLESCISNICDPIYHTYNNADNAWEEAKLDERVARTAANTAQQNADQAYNEFETASQAYDDAHTAYVNYRDSLVPPISASQQAHLNQLAAQQAEALQASNAAEEHYNTLFEISEQADEDLADAVAEVERTELARDQALHVYESTHCDIALAFQAPPLEPNTAPQYDDPPTYNADPYNQPQGYEQQPTPSPTTTPGRNVKEGSASSDSSIKSIVPRIPGADKTRAY